MLLAAFASMARAEEAGYLGVVLGQLPDGVAGPTGAIIQEIIQDSPADRDGLRAGDVIIAMDNNEIKDAQGLIDAAQQAKSGDQVRLKVNRAGEPDKKELTITLGNHPATPLADLPRKKLPSLGIAFSLQADGRLAAAQFPPDSAAERAGMKPGDVITTISGHEAKDYIAIRSLIAAHQSGDEVKIQVTRDGQTQELTVALK